MVISRVQIEYDIVGVWLAIVIVLLFVLVTATIKYSHRISFCLKNDHV